MQADTTSLVAKLQQDVTRLASFPRNFSDSAGLSQTSDWIRTEWEQAGFQVTDQAFQFNEKPYKNLLTFYGPPDAERVVIGAHYDVCGDIPGADDNASGVAGLLALSRLLKIHAPTLRKRIDLAAYTLEEAGMRGSYVHAESLKKLKTKIKGMISLEMIGYFSDDPGSQKFPDIGIKHYYPDTGNFIAAVGDFGSRHWIDHVAKAMNKHSETKVCTLSVPAFLAPVVNRSDHASFRRLKIAPAFMLTDTANFRNPNYHKLTDTPETLDFQRMADVVQGVYETLVELTQ